MNRTWNPGDVADPFAAYSHCCEIAPGRRLLVIAGQVGVAPDGHLATDIEGQCEWALRNVVSILQANQMQPADLVKLGVFLTRREDLAAYRAVRARVLGEEVAPPGTLLIVAGLAHPDWLVEIEAYAAAGS